MFKIQKRHNPMFVLSEVRQLARIFTDVLKFGDFNLRDTGVEIIDLSQTVRINENNQFIVKSDLNPDQVISILNKTLDLERFKTADNSSILMEKLIKDMISVLGIDSYLSIGEGASFIKIKTLFPEATKQSQKPLIIFNDVKNFDYQWSGADWEGIDHPALWIGENWFSAMNDVEAFFAMSPELKLEVSLNRYQTLENFGNFSVGLVRF